MTLPTVPTGNIVGMSISMTLGLLIPIALFVWLRKKYKAHPTPFFIGIVMFYVFSMVLEQVFNSLVLRSPFGGALSSNIWLYGLYGGLAAGVFEEVGRYVAFTRLLKVYRKPVNGIMYGAGHGSAELVMLLTLNMFNNIVYSCGANQGKISLDGVSGTDLEAMVGTIQKLADLNGGMLFAGFVERIAALVLQMALSVLVFVAVKGVGKKWALYAAIGIHAAVNFVAVVLYNVSNDNAWLTELVVILMTAGACWLAAKLYGEYKTWYLANREERSKINATPIFESAVYDESEEISEPDDEPEAEKDETESE